MKRNSVVLIAGKFSYSPKKLLGRGSDGTRVYEGKYYGNDVAVKRMNFDLLYLRDRGKKLQQISEEHQNINRFYFMFKGDEFLFIVLGLCDFDLSKYFPVISDPPPNELLKNLRDEFKIRDILYQTTDGIRFLHKKQILHRDIKPQNVLVSKSTGKWKVKISDFGIAKMYTKECITLTQASSTPLCNTLEVLNDLKMSKSTDVYSLGCFFFFMVSGGFYPFDVTHVNLLNEVWTKSESNAFQIFKSSIDSDETFLANHLIQKMLCNERPTAQQIAQHAFFWDNKKIMEFFEKIAKYGKIKSFKTDLNVGYVNIIIGSWKSNLDEALLKNIDTDRRNRNLKENCIFDLVKYIRRNWVQISEHSQEVKKLLGSSEESHIEYWTTVFPKLFSHVYCKVLDNKSIFFMDFQKDFASFDL